MPLAVRRGVLLAPIAERIECVTDALELISRPFLQLLVVGIGVAVVALHALTQRLAVVVGNVDVPSQISDGATVRRLGLRQVLDLFAHRIEGIVFADGFLIAHGVLLPNVSATAPIV